MQGPVAETLSGLPEVLLRKALHRAQRVDARNDLPDVGTQFFELLDPLGVIRAERPQGLREG